VFNCGGNWNNSGNAGVFYLNGNNSRDDVNANIGFRAALPHGITYSTARDIQPFWADRLRASEAVRQMP